VLKHILWEIVPFGEKNYYYFDLGYLLSFIWTNTAPRAAINIPAISLADIVSPRNIQASTAIWISIVPFIILDSIAVNVRRV
jgi:hypothetical protein